MVALAIAAGSADVGGDVPPATGYEGRVTGRRMASPEVVDRRRLNRHAASAARRGRARIGSARVVMVDASEPDGPADPYKFDTAIGPMVLPIVCSGPWLDAVGDALALRRENGKPVVPYAVKPPRKVTSDGKTSWAIALSTTAAKLVELIDTAGVYPPAAADPANRMRPCCCAKCRSPDGQRSRLYPAIHVRRGLSYDCWCDRHHVDPDIVAMMDPDAAYLLALSRVRERDVMAYDDNPASGRRQPQKIVDRRDAVAPVVDAWRHERLCVLGVESRTALAALRQHRWSHVGGTVKAKLVKRRLKTVGDLWDYLHL